MRRSEADDAPHHTAFAGVLREASHQFASRPTTRRHSRAPGVIPIESRNGARVKAADLPPQGVYRPNYNLLTPNMRSPE